MEKIDWSKAPEGAEFYCPENEGWYKMCNGNPMFYSAIGSDWVPSSFWPLYGKTCCPRPSPAWSGEGLPPTGTVCECQNQAMKWLKGTIVYVGKDNGTRLAIMQTDTEILYGEAGEFRPIRTPEQIAADERLHEIRNALTAINSKVKFPNDLVRGNILAAAVEAMIDAGYRKQEQPK